MNRLKSFGALCVAIASIFAFWYAAILFSGLPAFVLPRPLEVLNTLVADWGFLSGHLLVTLKSAALGYSVANIVGIAVAALFVAMPWTRSVLMPVAVTARNIPYVSLVTVLVLAVGDGLGAMVTIVAVAGFFPVLVNTYRGLNAVDPVILDRMHVLNVPAHAVFRHVRLPSALPFIVSAQEITASGSIIVTIAAEWMMSNQGLGYVLNRAMSQYRGDQVYAVSLLAALISYGLFLFVGWVGRRLDWNRSN